MSNGADRPGLTANQRTEGYRNTVTLRVDGHDRRIVVDVRTTLLDALRDRLGCMSPKKGCDHGQCGSCTVLLDSRRVVTCLALAVAYGGADIVTAAGLAERPTHPLQDAFADHDALQCGYCTPGRICSATGMFAEFDRGDPSAVTAPAGSSALDDAEIRERMSGNLIRRDGRWLVGTGVAAATYPHMVSPGTEVTVRYVGDGRFSVRTGAADIGTGAWTALTLVAADALGCHLEGVDVEIGDSALPNATVAGGSSGTSSWGSTIVAAADEFHKRYGDHPESGAEAGAAAREDPELEHYSIHSFGAHSGTRRARGCGRCLRASTICCRPCGEGPGHVGGLRHTVLERASRCGRIHTVTGAARHAERGWKTPGRTSATWEYQECSSQHPGFGESVCHKV